jgi:glucuronokinase
MTIQHTAYARVGLLGNPSDGYFGKTLAFSVRNFAATVTLEPSESLVILPHPVHDPSNFASLQQLAERVESEGYYGGVRLLMATCKVFHAYCAAHKIALHHNNFTLSYDTNIPRQAGLSGSSAIVCAALSCLLEHFDVGDSMKVEDRPRVILTAEEELGITAGLQDRVAQVYGGLVYMVCLVLLPIPPALLQAYGYLPLASLSFGLVRRFITKALEEKVASSQSI